MGQNQLKGVHSFLDSSTLTYTYEIEVHKDPKSLIHVLCFLCTSSLGAGIKQEEAIFNALELDSTQPVWFPGEEEAHLICVDCVALLSDAAIV